MKITILVDNTTNMRGLKAESGFSLYITDQRTNILFDTGCSTLFLENAHQLDIDLLKLDYIVLSHGHYDHTWGLPHLHNLYQNTTTIPAAKPILLAHPVAFHQRTRGATEMGCNITESQLLNSFTIKKSVAPVWLTDKLVFLGEITRNFPYEGNHTIGEIFKNGTLIPDIMEDDTALAYKSSQGLIIITGCSHSGICNIVEQAKQICQEDRIFAIIGGLHLRKPPTEQLTNTINYLEKSLVQQLYACHCTDQPSRMALEKLGNLQETTVGLTIEYE